MPDNLRYIHGGWLVVRASHARQFTLHTRCLVSRTPDNLLYFTLQTRKPLSVGRAAGESSEWPATKTD